MMEPPTLASELVPAPDAVAGAGLKWQKRYSKSKRQWYIRLRSLGNARTIVWSEYYHNKADAEHALELVRRHAATAPART